MRNSYEVRAQKFIRAIAPYLVGCLSCFDYSDAVDSFVSDHPNRKVLFDHGMTRVALITADYVVKINYDEEEVARFGGGEQEIAFYQMAEREGMAHLFAKISRYDFGGRTYYIMPRVTGIDEDRWEDAWYYMTDTEYKWCEDHNLYDLHCKNYGIVNGKVKIFDYGAYDGEQTKVYSHGPARLCEKVINLFFEKVLDFFQNQSIIIYVRGREKELTTDYSIVRM